MDTRMTIVSTSPAGDSLFVRDFDGQLWFVDVLCKAKATEKQAVDWLVHGSHVRFGLRVKSWRDVNRVADGIMRSWHRRVFVVKVEPTLAPHL